MVLIVQLSNSCIWPIVRILPLFNELKASATIYDKITKYDGEAIQDNNRDKEFKFNSNIEVKDLKFAYEGKEILKELPLALKGKNNIKGPVVRKIYFNKFTFHG